MSCSSVNKRLPSRLRFIGGEALGSMGDIGTLLPLTLGLIANNGINCGTALILFGGAYILTGIYYRLPMPVQPLKAAAMIAIATGASVGEIRAAAFIVGAVLLFLAISRLADKLSDFFPKVLIAGLQFSLGILMIRAGAKFVLSHPSSLGSVVTAQNTSMAGVSADGFFPSGAMFLSALFVLALPQLPLTIGNSVLATRDCALKYFGDRGRRVTAGRLAATVGLANLASGLLGGIPMCHGAGGMTAHYRFGAKTGVSGVIIGSLLLFAGIMGDRWSTTLLSATPASVLGLMLLYVGIRHAALAKEHLRRPQTAMTVLTMGLVVYLTSDMLMAFLTGLVVKTLVQDATPWMRRRLTPAESAVVETE